MFRSPLPPALLALMLLAVGAQADVLVVDDDGGPGVDHLTIQAAVLAASEGDIVLVKEGSYPAVSIVQRGLSIIVEAGETAVVPSIHVADTSAAQQIVIRGVDALPQPGDTNGGISVANCDGSVFVQDGVFEGSPEPSPLNDAAGATVSDSAGVTFRGCTLAGARTPDGAAVSAAGLFATNSRVLLFDCLARGGDGDSLVSSLAAPPGRPGVQNVGGELVVFGGSFVGGTGGDGALTTPQGGGCADGGAGGPALRNDVVALPGGPIFGSFDLRGVTLTGGEGGPAGGLGCVPGAPGPTIPPGTGGSIVQVPWVSRRLDQAATAREGQLYMPTFVCPPGEIFALVIGFLFDDTPLGPKGVLLPGGVPLKILNLGVMPPAGSLTLTISVPLLPPGFEGVMIAEQIATSPVGGGVRLGTPDAVTVFDASI